MTDALVVDSVSHSFGKLKALDGVSLTVPAGRFVALLGVNGAGKTTLFSLVTRLYDNVTGGIAVCGHDLRRTPGPALAELGVVFQSRALDADLSIANSPTTPRSTACLAAHPRARRWRRSASPTA